MTKRMLSLLMALVLCVGLLPVQVLAEDVCTCTTQCGDEGNTECKICALGGDDCSPNLDNNSGEDSGDGDNDGQTPETCQCETFCDGTGCAFCEAGGECTGEKPAEEDKLCTKTAGCTLLDGHTEEECVLPECKCDADCTDAVNADCVSCNAGRVCAHKPAPTNEGISLAADLLYLVEVYGAPFLKGNEEYTPYVGVTPMDGVTLTSVTYEVVPNEGGDPFNKVVATEYIERGTSLAAIPNAGYYYIKATATDSTGATGSLNSAVFEVRPDVWVNQISISDEENITAYQDSAVYIEASDSHGYNEPTNVSFSITKAGQVIHKCSSETSKVCDHFKPQIAGTYACTVTWYQGDYVSTLNKDFEVKTYSNPNYDEEAHCYADTVTLLSGSGEQLDFSASYPVEETSVKISVTLKGNAEKLQGVGYRLTNETTGEIQTVYSNYNNPLLSNSVTLYDPGVYSCTATVYDTDGAISTAESTQKLTVEEPKPLELTSLTVDKTSANVGETVTFTVTTTGDGEPRVLEYYFYTRAAFDAQGDSIHVASSYYENMSSLYPAYTLTIPKGEDDAWLSGEYVCIAVLQDYLEEYSYKETYFNVVNPNENAAKVTLTGPETPTYNQEMTLTVTLENPENKTVSNVKILKNIPGVEGQQEHATNLSFTNNTCTTTFTPVVSGEYAFAVEVYFEGEDTPITNSYTFNIPSLGVKPTDVEFYNEQITVGSYVMVCYNIENYEQAVEATVILDNLDPAVDDSALQYEGEVDSYNICTVWNLPVGSYKATVKIKDERGEVTEAETAGTLVVAEKEGVTLTANPAAPAYNEEVTFTVALSNPGNKTVSQVKLLKTIPGETTAQEETLILTDNQATATFTPKTAGEHTFTVQVFFENQEEPLEESVTFTLPASLNVIPSNVHFDYYKIPDDYAPYINFSIQNASKRQTSKLILENQDANGENQEFTITGYANQKLTNIPAGTYKAIFEVTDKQGEIRRAEAPELLVVYPAPVVTLSVSENPKAMHYATLEATLSGFDGFEVTEVWFYFVHSEDESIYLELDNKTSLTAEVAFPKAGTYDCGVEVSYGENYWECSLGMLEVAVAESGVTAAITGPSETYVNQECTFTAEVTGMDAGDIEDSYLVVFAYDATKEDPYIYQETLDGTTGTYTFTQTGSYRIRSFINGCAAAEHTVEVKETPEISFDSLGSKIETDNTVTLSASVNGGTVSALNFVVTKVYTDNTRGEPVTIEGNLDTMTASFTPDASMRYAFTAQVTCAETQDVVHTSQELTFDFCDPKSFTVELDKVLDAVYYVGDEVVLTFDTETISDGVLEYRMFKRDGGSFLETPVVVGTLDSTKKVPLSSGGSFYIQVRLLRKYADNTLVLAEGSSNEFAVRQGIYATGINFSSENIALGQSVTLTPMTENTNQTGSIKAVMYVVMKETTGAPVEVASGMGREGDFAWTWTPEETGTYFATIVLRNNLDVVSNNGSSKRVTVVEDTLKPATISVDAGLAAGETSLKQNQTGYTVKVTGTIQDTNNQFKSITYNLLHRATENDVGTVEKSVTYNTMTGEATFSDFTPTKRGFYTVQMVLTSIYDNVTTLAAANIAVTPQVTDNNPDVGEDTVVVEPGSNPPADTGLNLSGTQVEASDSLLDKLGADLPEEADVELEFTLGYTTAGGATETSTLQGAAANRVIVGGNDVVPAAEPRLVLVEINAQLNVSNGSSFQSERLTDLPEAVEIGIPFNTAGKTNFRVYSYHNGLKQYTPRIADGKLWITVSQFSLFGVVYDEAGNITYKDSDGTTLQTDVYGIGTGKASLYSPSKDGYDFAGWYVGNTKVTNITAAETGNVTLTAKWVETPTKALSWHTTVDGNPATGDSILIYAAMMPIAACALFVLLMAKKKRMI